MDMQDEMRDIKGLMVDNGEIGDNGGEIGSHKKGLIWRY